LDPVFQGFSGILTNFTGFLRPVAEDALDESPKKTPPVADGVEPGTMACAIMTDGASDPHFAKNAKVAPASRLAVVRASSPALVHGK
jgi:hypothetical protein